MEEIANLTIAMVTVLSFVVVVVVSPFPFSIAQTNETEAFTEDVLLSITLTLDLH